MNWRETPATTAIAALTIIVSGLITLVNRGDHAAVAAGFVPGLVSGTAYLPDGVTGVPVWLTPLSATLVHAGFVHLALNMVMLVYCGREAERALGWIAIVILYLVGAYVAAFGQWLPDPSSPEPMIGASGAISALLAAYALLYGRRRARKIGPVPAGVVHVAWLAVAWIGINLLMGVGGLAGQTIAVGAHIGGFFAGLLLTRPLLLWRYRRA